MNFLRSCFMLSCTCLLLLAPLPGWAFDAPPAGEYRVAGSDSTNGQTDQYSGTLQLKNTEEIYSFEGVVDGQAYHGAGLYDTQSRILSLAFQGESPEEQGLTVLKWDGKRLAGHWLHLNTPQAPLGYEEWSPAQ